MPEALLSQVRSEAAGSGHRVTASIAGESLWFESIDPLDPRPEAIASATLLALTFAGHQLEIEDPVSRRWADGARRALELVHQWWGLPLAPPIARIEDPPRAALADGPSVLAFTGGVDGFFTLLHGPRIDRLVFALGYDARLVFPNRVDSVQGTVERIAAALGLPLTVISTNLRELEFFDLNLWGRVHGGPVAALGHLLGPECRRIYVSSTSPARALRPWGSHPDLDPLWSTETTDVVHFGEAFTRNEKLRAMASEPLVQQYLRVCNRRDYVGVNCGVCEKCVRTQLTLASLGVLDRFPGFPDASGLAKRVAAVWTIPNNGVMVVYDQLLEWGLPPDIEREMRTLMRRTRKYDLRVAGVPPLRVRGRVLMAARRARTHVRRLTGRR